MTAPMLKLYEYVDQYQAILDTIEERAEEIAAAGGVLPPDLEAALDAVDGSITEKIERVALVVQNLAANAKAAEEEAKRLAALAATYTRQADSLKRYLHAQLLRLGETRVETPRVKVAVQKNGRPSIRPANPDAIPEKYQRVRIEFDGQRAYEDLKAAGLLPDEPGTVEIDGLVIERGTHLRIR